MKKMYCPDCGVKMEYAAKAPNFCISCGYSFNSSLKSVNEKKAEIDNKSDELEEPGEEGEKDRNYDYGEIKKLDVEIESSSKSGTKISDLVGSLPEGFRSAPQPTKRKGKQKSKEAFLAEFKQEAGSLREKRKG